MIRFLDLICAMTKAVEELRMEHGLSPSLRKTKIQALESNDLEKLLASPEVDVIVLLIVVANKLEALLSGPDKGYASSIDDK
jgi:hypothetical protein